MSPPKRKVTDHVVDDSGTALGDRKYRPDVEGLRAVAVMAVVMFHAGLGHMRSGFVGVDVFFVISGFVITGVLLRKSESHMPLGLAEFYARRCRRILPAAGLVLTLVIFASYHWLGFIRGAEVADDARWCAVFLGNVHFSAVDTNYFSAKLPSSPLQNYWSLGVEEQFYVFYPCALAACVALSAKVPVRVKVQVFTGIVFVASLAWSIYYTSKNPTAAYFSSFTRAWELAAGGFVCAGTKLWKQIPKVVGAALSWLGTAAVVLAVFLFTTSTPYPGSAALLPVLGAVLIIVGGTPASKWGSELVLGTFPFRWIGRCSFSLYLWSWPILTLMVESSTKALTTPQRLVSVVLALGASAATYFAIENPVRHSRVLAKSSWRSIAVGAIIVAAVLTVATIEIHTTQAL